MSIVRVRPDVCAVVYDAATTSHVSLTPGLEFDSGDPIVRQHPWAFRRDADVEEATAAPGQRRGR